MVDKIMTYESGELDGNEILELFAELIKSGLCWTLQEHYGRVAQSLIENGYISESGEILQTV